MLQDRKIFEDRFKVQALDPDNKTPFRNVSRTHMSSEYKIDIEIDIQTQIYPVKAGESYLINMSTSDSSKTTYNQEDTSLASEMNKFDYVMYGMVYNLEEKEGMLIVFISFGGLLMRVQGKVGSLSNFRREGAEARVYLMMRKA